MNAVLTLVYTRIDDLHFDTKDKRETHLRALKARNKYKEARKTIPIPTQHPSKVMKRKKTHLGNKLSNM